MLCCNTCGKEFKTERQLQRHNERKRPCKKKSSEPQMKGLLQKTENMTMSNKQKEVDIILNIHSKSDKSIDYILTVSGTKPDNELLIEMINGRNVNQVEATTNTTFNVVVNTWENGNLPIDVINEPLKDIRCVEEALVNTLKMVDQNNTNTSSSHMIHEYKETCVYTNMSAVATELGQISNNQSQ